MAYLPHCQVILKGVLGVSALIPSETWQTGHQISDTNFVDLPSQSQANAIADAWRFCFAASTMNLADFAFLTSVEVVAIGPDGKWLKNPDGSYKKRVGVVPAPAVGSANVQLDYPVSTVVSLMTARAGAHGRGRMYWPVPGEPPDDTGHVSDASATARATRVAQAFQEINTALATGTYQGKAVVASSAGFLSDINNVRVGNVHDTQRRRRAQLVEKYQIAAV